MFEGWDSFYQITGEASATLTGLLFVVATLTGDRERSRVLRAVSIYLTPTVLHFAVVLSVSAVAVVPRLTLPARVGVVAIAAFTGLGNAIWACVGIRARTPGTETPHWSDFWLYGVAPVAVYLALGAVAIGLEMGLSWSAQAMAALLLALLLLGIRNGWDLITWMAPKADAPPPDRGAGGP